MEFVLIVLIICLTILVYTAIDRNLPEPPKSNFELIVDALDSELSRLHQELDPLTQPNSEGYKLLVDEIGRVNQQLANLRDSVGVS